MTFDRVITIQKIILALLIILILGAIFLVPNIFMSQFYTFSALWTIAGIMIISIISLILNKIVVIEFSTIILITLAAIFTLLFSYRTIYGVSGILFLFFALNFIVKNLNIKVHHNLLYSSLSIIVLVLSLCSIYQHLFIPKNNSFQIIGSFDNPSGFAVCTSMLFPYILFIKYKRTDQELFLKYLIGVVCIIAVVLSQSRAGIIGLCFTLLLWLLNGNSQGVLFPQKHKYSKKIVFSFIIISLTVISLCFFKYDSTNGRFFIIKISTTLLSDNPFWGAGANTFMTNYMSSQANFFALNTESPFSILADNIKHPMNEYLLILIEYGICGFGLLGIYIIYIISSYLSSKFSYKTPALYSLISLLIISMFSYPMKYPVIWILTGIAIAIIINGGSKEYKICPAIKTTTIIPAIIIVLIPICQRWIDERQWFKIANISHSGKTLEVISEYEYLYKRLNNIDFLYNYAAELSMVQRYEHSNKILKECIYFINDTDIQLLMAENYLQLKEYNKASECLLLAHNMCPNRFIPLYRLMVLHTELKEYSEAHNIANIIVNKQIKIPSTTINLIIKEAHRILDENNKTTP